MDDDKEQLLRQYAQGETTWAQLQVHGFESYRNVLAGLGALGLRPPVAPMDGPNWEARERGRTYIREALRAVR